MHRRLRLALQVVVFFILLSLVVAIGSAETGTVETVGLIAAGAVLAWFASRVRRIGAGDGRPADSSRAYKLNQRNGGSA